MGQQMFVRFVPLFDLAFTHNGQRYLKVLVVFAVEELDLVEARVRNSGGSMV